MSRLPPQLPPGRAPLGGPRPPPPVPGSAQGFAVAPGAPAAPRAPPAPQTSTAPSGEVGAGDGSTSTPPGDRSALLSQIHQGARLKKTVTNDRSAPAFNGAKNSSSCGPAGGGSQATAFPKAIPGLGGGLRPPIGKSPSPQPPYNAAKTTPRPPSNAPVRGSPGPPPRKSTPTPAAPRGNARWPPPAPGK